MAKVSETERERRKQNFLLRKVRIMRALRDLKALLPDDIELYVTNEQIRMSVGDMDAEYLISDKMDKVATRIFAAYDLYQLKV